MTSSAVLPPVPRPSIVVANRVSPIVPIQNPMTSWAAVYLALAAVNCIFQIAWFWRYTSHNINYDAVSYIGIARHILDGEFHTSLHGYWSPLVSWCIAAASIFNHNLLLDARIITVTSFLACLPLIYLLCFRLWRSSTVASFSVLCFSLARGVVAFSVYFIGADFLLTAAILGYFVLLLQCLREPTTANWLKLGAAHGLAFLGKAFAMPWLAFSTLLAAVFLYRGRPKRATNAIAALIIPLLVWVGWGLLLNTKYGRFTAGYQSKWNLLNVETRKSADKAGLSVLQDTSRSNDDYMVVDSMYPASPLWRAHIELRETIRQTLIKEAQNVPRAIKQVIVLATPGGIFAIPLALLYLHRHAMKEEAMWAWVAIGSTISLVLGYCMLVFDDRYVLPAVPLLIVLAARFLLPTESTSTHKFIRFAPAVMFAGAIIFLALYWASPFRTIRRDYQTGVYEMSATLRKIPNCERLVAIGKGPSPERGVGWEIGIYASYFSQCRIVGFTDEIPSPEKADSTVTDIKKLHANSILLLGDPSNSNYAALLKAIRDDSQFSASNPLHDPVSGQIGLLLWK